MRQISSDINYASCNNHKYSGQCDIVLAQRSLLLGNHFLMPLSQNSLVIVRVQEWMESQESQSLSPRCTL